MRTIDLGGQKFGRLSVIRLATKRKRRRHWYCQCDCGQFVTVSQDHLRNGHTSSCGCLAKETIGRLNRSHGKSGWPEYQIWSNMISRCKNKSQVGYKNYGGRGISVCKRWLTFDNFFADIGKRPSSKHSLERINNDGNYEPINCRWATRKEQASNTRRNVFITFAGETLTIYQWAKKTGIAWTTLYNRLYRSKWPIEYALTKPIMDPHQRGPRYLD